MQQMNERDWSQSDLARASGLTRATISYYMGKKSKRPEDEALRKIAKALNVPTETAYRAAGILPKLNAKDALAEKIIHELDQLPMREREDILQYIQLRRQITEDRGEYNVNHEAQKRPAKT